MAGVRQTVDGVVQTANGVPQTDDIPDSQGYLYNEGEYESAWIEGGGFGVGDQSKETDHLFAAGGPDDTGSAERAWVTEDLIDLSGVNTIEVEWESGADFYEGSIAAHTDQNGTYFEASTDLRRSVDTDFARTTESFDVSGLSDQYYIALHARDGVTSEALSELITYRVQIVA